MEPILERCPEPAHDHSALVCEAERASRFARRAFGKWTEKALGRRQGRDEGSTGGGRRKAWRKRSPARQKAGRRAGGRARRGFPRLSNPPHQAPKAGTACPPGRRRRRARRPPSPPPAGLACSGAPPPAAGARPRSKTSGRGTASTPNPRLPPLPAPPPARPSPAVTRRLLSASSTSTSSSSTSSSSTSPSSSSTSTSPYYKMHPLTQLSAPSPYYKKCIPSRLCHSVHTNHSLRTYHLRHSHITQMIWPKSLADETTSQVFTPRPNSVVRSPYANFKLALDGLEVHPTSRVFPGNPQGSWSPGSLELHLSSTSLELHFT